MEKTALEVILAKLGVVEKKLNRIFNAQLRAAKGREDDHLTEMWDLWPRFEVMIEILCQIDRKNRKTYRASQVALNSRRWVYEGNICRT